MPDEPASHPEPADTSTDPDTRTKSEAGRPSSADSAGRPSTDAGQDSALQDDQTENDERAESAESTGAEHPGDAEDKPGAKAESHRSAVRRTATAIALAPPEIFAWFWNPIFGKELRVSSRRPRSYILRSGYLLTLILIMLVTWWANVNAQDPYGADPGSVAARVQQQITTGFMLSHTFAWVQFVAIALVAPILTSTAVSDEIENRSLPALLATPLTTAQIVVGKLMSRMAHVLLIILLGVPLLLGMRTYGGFDVPQLIRIDVLCITAALLGASVGLLMSMWERRGWRAATIACFWLLLWWVVIPGVLFWAYMVRLFGGTAGGTIGGFDLLEAAFGASMHITPISCMFWLTVSASGAPIGFTPVDAHTAWMWCNITNVFLAVLLLGISMLLLRRRARGAIRQAAEAGAPSTKKKHGFRLAKRTMAGPTADPHVVTTTGRDDDRAVEARLAFTRATAPSGTSENGAPQEDFRESEWARSPSSRLSDWPIVWREYRIRFLSTRLKRFIGWTAIVLLLAWYYYAAEPWDEPFIHLPFVFIMLTFQLLLACFASTQVVTHEKQGRTWDVLLCMPLTPRQIMWQKYIGANVRMYIPLAILLLHLIIFALFTTLSWLFVLHTGMIAVSFSLFISAIGVWCSLVVRRGTTAMALNVLITIGLLGGLPLLCMLTAELFSDRPWAPSIDPFEITVYTLLINPYYWQGVASEPVVRTAWRGWHGVRDITYDTGLTILPEGGSLTVGMFTVVLTAACLTVVAIGAFILETSGRMFNRCAKRPS